jgi:hypothetical protein
VRSKWAKTVSTGCPKARSTSAIAQRRIEGRYLILQAGQFIGDVGGQQVATGQQDLPNLTKMGPSVSSARRSLTARGSA